MRRGTILFLVINLIIIGFLVNAFSTLISLLFEDGAIDAIHHAEIPAPGSDLIQNQTNLIPKIIHQTYINASIPSQWQAGQQACKDLHPDYEYKLWTDELSRGFIKKEYPWFLETFDGYSFPIQRADAIRYFVLTFYGGVYIDLDDGCNRRLEPLLKYPAWLRWTTPTGISNDAMGSVPQHPFFIRTIESLQVYNQHWVLPYITIMYSTGPLFLSLVWKEYLQELHTVNERVRVLMPDEYSKHTWSFFNISKGSSWHGGDARTIFWMGKHWLLLTVAGFAVAGIVGLCWWWVLAVYILGGGNPHQYSAAPRGMRRWGLFRRPSKKFGYELIDRTA